MIWATPCILVLVILNGHLLGLTAEATALTMLIIFFSLDLLFKFLKLGWGLSNGWTIAGALTDVRYTRIQ